MMFTPIDVRHTLTLFFGQLFAEVRAMQDVEIEEVLDDVLARATASTMQKLENNDESPVEAFALGGLIQYALLESRVEPEMYMADTESTDDGTMSQWPQPGTGSLCPACGGTGTTGNTFFPCPQCDGRGYTAKSDIVRDVANERGIPVIDVRLNQHDMADLRGIPIANKSQWVVRWRAKDAETTHISGPGTYAAAKAHLMEILSQHSSHESDLNVRLDLAEAVRGVRDLAAYGEYREVLHGWTYELVPVNASGA